MNNHRRSLLIALAATPLALPAQAAGPANVDAHGVAIHGHDPVAYFTQGQPQRGQPQWRVDLPGRSYLFASAQHKQTFEAAPARYEPQYGGYCAYGVAQGVKPDVDPSAFRIVDGKLYLNLSPAVQKRWQADIPGFINRANQNWPGLKGQ